MLIFPCVGHEGIQKVAVWLHTFLPIALNGGERSAALALATFFHRGSP